MGRRNTIGSVSVEPPVLADSSWADSPRWESARAIGLPSQNQWVAEEAGKQSQGHIVFLLLIVLLISAFGLWFRLRDDGSVPYDEQPSMLVAIESGSGQVSQDLLSEESVKMATSEGAVAGVERLAGGIAPLFTPEVRYWEPDILRWATEYGVDPNIVATIMQIESCGNPEATSFAGAQGLFQVMPFHFQTGENMLDPDTNAMRGMAFFREQMRFTGDDVLLSFAGYNGGYAASGGVYGNWAAETQRYYYWAKGIYFDATSGASQSATLAEWLVAGGGGGCQIAAGVLGI